MPRGRPKKSEEERYATTGIRKSRRERDSIATSKKPQGTTQAFEDFLLRVQLERSTFAERIVPDQTIALGFDNSKFEWPVTHPLTIARDYASDVVDERIVTGALTKLAAKRFLDDLETCAARRLYLDPEAAANISTWFTTFNLAEFKLQPWEVWILVQMFGWKQETGLRRFREVWFECAKKNGKTALMAGIALFALLGDCEPKAEVYTAANSKDQARICFRAAKAILEECPALGNAAKILHNSFLAQSGSFYHPLSSDIRAVDGPSVSCALFDEVHEFASTTLWDKLTAGTIARQQPLILSCTTAGESPHGFAWERHEMFTKLLAGTCPDDSKLVIIYAIDDGDDCKDEASWKKANPNLGVTVRLEALREQVREIESYPQKLTPFLRYHLNTWVTLGASHTLPLDKINACAGPYDLPPMDLRKWFLEFSKDLPAYGGFDLGIVEDMTCFCAFYPDVRFDGMQSGQPPYLVAVPYFWIPADRVIEKAKAWDVPLDVWVRQGWVKVTEGNYVDMRVIKADLKDILWTTGKFRDVGFDAWNSQVLMSELHDEKIAKCTRVPQHEGFLTAPAQELIRAVVQGRLVHLKNPVMTWQLGNAVLEENDRGGIVCQKLSQNEKVDAVQALLNAMQRWLLPDEADKYSRRSVYNNRGVQVL